jgi:hypothetical protein
MSDHHIISINNDASINFLVGYQFPKVKESPMFRNLLVLTIGLLIVFISDPALADKKDKKPKHLKDLKCAVNEIAKFNGIKWKCSLDEDTGDTLRDLSCDTSQIAEYDGTEWVCADKGDSDSPAGPKLEIFDSDDPPKPVGTALQFLGATNDMLTVVPFEDSQQKKRNIIMFITPNEIPPNGSVFFSEPDCSDNSVVIGIPINSIQNFFISEIGPGRDIGVITRGDNINDPNWFNKRRVYTTSSNVFQNVPTQSSQSGSVCGNISPPENRDIFPVELLDPDLHNTFPPTYNLEIQ